ncbi:hypothetical protein SOCE836_008810 [Sorangium cellulosum]|uniref:DUF378 domain-containing protein n=2 Tax=Polyangiaceae TaxID=49 RepID=A0A4P2QGZ5_SORCE|nr:hypothetical protein SOCE836_008810 [Sorangium cellulosum]WCQ88195.1 hypothetical protein NQZ70_00869 [Sorangium sp. Soce836]
MLLPEGMEQVNREISGLTWTAIVLVVIGAVNWALVGLFDFNLVAAIFGRLSAITRIVYVLVGLAGLYLLYASVQLGKRARVSTMP